MTVPLVVRRRAIGAITLVAAESRRRYGEADLAIALDLARRAATAVDNALLYREALIKESQVRFVAEAGGILSELLDYDETLAAIARLAVPRIADWCIVDVVDGAEIRRVAVAADDEEKQAAARRAARALSADLGLAAAGRAGAARRRARDLQEVRGRAARGDRRRRAPPRDHADARSALRRRDAARRPRREGRRDHVRVVPQTRRLYSERDLPLMEDLATRAALAVDNARLYARERATRRPACVPRRDELGARVLARLRDDARERRAADRPAVRRLVRGRHRRRGRLDRAHRSRPQGRPRSNSGRAARATCIRPSRPSRRAPRASSGRARPMLYRRITDEFLEQTAPGPENLEVLRELGMASAMVVPMKARGRTLGALMLVSSDPRGSTTTTRSRSPSTWAAARRPRSTTRFSTAARSSARRRRGRSRSSPTASCSSTRTGSSASGTRRRR